MFFLVNLDYMTLIPYKFHLIFELKGVLSYPDAEKMSNTDILMHLHDGGLRAGCDEDLLVRVLCTTQRSLNAVARETAIMQHRGVCGSKPLLRRLTRLVFAALGAHRPKRWKNLFANVTIREKPGRHAHARVYIIPAYDV